jgi:hypothetical protein
MVPDYLITECLIDKNKIPESLRPELIKLASVKYINNYVELNNYYRMLNGIPPIGDIGIKLNISSISNDILNIIDENKYIHEMNNAEIELLTSSGVLTKIISENPTKKYLNYLGSKKISIYTARTTSKFGLLYIDVPPSIQVYERFKNKLEINTIFTLKTIYSEAYKINSMYYDKFIMIMILIQTMVDMVIELPEYIIRKDIFDIETIKYIFESNGIEYFPEIPIQYQISMVRNLNKLIKFKSTTINIIDICKLFGFENIDVFKYYILRDRKIDPNTGKYLFVTKEVPDPNNPDLTITILDNEENYDLKFIKIPIDGIVDDYIKNNTNIVKYDDITLSDKHWDGNDPHDVVMKKILNKEFNYELTGFISIDTLYQITELAFEIPYFFNMLFDNTLSKEQLKINLPSISSATQFNFVDVFIYLYALIYQYNNIEDRIMYSQGQVLQVRGFNFTADLGALATYIKQQGYTMEQLGCSNFQIPPNGVLTYNQLMFIFVKNREIYDHIVSEMEKCDNLRLYNIYKKIYDSLMITELNMNYFKLPNGNIAETYTEFLSYKSPLLYNSITEISSISDEEIKRKSIINAINNTVYSLQNYIDSEYYDFMFYNVPTVSIDAVKQYIFKVINFFKSYKLDLLDINTIYKLNDENKIKILDNISMNINLEKSTVYYCIDTLNSITVTTNIRDHISMVERIYIEPFN